MPAHWLAFHVQEPQPLDPAVFTRGRPVFGGCIQVVAEPDAPRSGPAVYENDVVVDHALGECARAAPSSTARAAVNTLSVVTSARQSGVWPTHRSGGRRMRLHGAHGKSTRTSRSCGPRGPYRAGSDGPKTATTGVP